MEHASSICREKKDAAHLMRLAISAIQRERHSFVEDPTSLLRTEDDNERSVRGEPSEDEESVFDAIEGDRGKHASRSAYIIRQIKRPEEVEFLRGVYGDAFILISAYGSRKERSEALQKKIKASARTPINDVKAQFLAEKLIESDMNEDRDNFGQHMRDSFHLADAIIEGLDRTQITIDLERFISLLFGANDVGPTREEYGMNGAYQASLRSTDLSRQIGAIVYSPTGEVLTQGCNEVPRAFGGTYWDGESPDFRDVKLGVDSNDILKMDVLRDLFLRLKRDGILSDSVSSLGSPNKIADILVGRVDADEENKAFQGKLKNAKILDLTEYGRVVHAEMSAICDAARNGTSLRMATLFTTTFPCHNCTKHIIGAGVRKVIYLEPYPKSKAKELHNNEITIEEVEGKVSFIPFKGVAPRRYKGLFAKGKRKRNGEAVRWYHGSPAPMVNTLTLHYLTVEDLVKA